MDAEDRAELEVEADRRGCTVEDLYREAGGSDIPGEGWRFPETTGKGANEIRAMYDEENNFRTEDVRAIEIGDEAVFAQIVENGDTEEERKFAQQSVMWTAEAAEMQAMDIRGEAELENMRRTVEKYQRTHDETQRFPAEMEAGQ